MKILEEPSKAPWSGVFQCPVCKTRVELELADFGQVSHGRGGSAAAYKCPTCSRANWIDLQLIPQHLHHRLG